MSMYYSFTTNPAILKVTALNDSALQAERNGDLEAAESLRREVIALEENVYGGDSVEAALSRNALGELYLKLNRLDEAEENIRKAVEIRNSKVPATFDAAVSRENLAQLFEKRGMLREANQTRLQGSPDRIACGFYNCPGQMFRLTDLQKCSKCKCVYYCSQGCQLRDWTTRHKPLCRAAG